MDALTSTFSGKGVGTDVVFNVDAIIASAFKDLVAGGFNGERFELGAGDDRALGGFGNDTLLGQAGHDRLTGGTGADSFEFDVALTAANLDHVTDFNPVDDRVVLLQSGAGPFDALAPGALDARAFHLGSQARTAAQHVLYDRSTGLLAYDADGVGGAAAQAFAVLDHRPVIDAADFLVI